MDQRDAMSGSEDRYLCASCRVYSKAHSSAAAAAELVGMLKLLLMARQGARKVCILSVRMQQDTLTGAQ